MKGTRRSEVEVGNRGGGLEIGVGVEVGAAEGEVGNRGGWAWSAARYLL